MKKYVELVRVKHWIKNLLILIPMLCAKVINTDNILKCMLGFFAFSFLCSFVYIINDINDIEKDKKHPRKKNRPLPSGKISKKTAICISIILLIFVFVLNWYINKTIFDLSLYLLLAYLAMNIAYSFGLKNVAILDVAILASGFILRVYYGAAIVGVPVSNWLFLTIMNASLFLGLGKRKKELENNKELRKVLGKYNIEFLDKFQYLSLSLSIVFYSLWAMEDNNNNLILTIPLLMIIFMRYCLIIEKSDEGDPTTILYTDPFLIILCLLYSLMMVLCMFV